MPFSEELAERVRAELGSVTKVTEQTMFGGLAFMVAGNMACGVTGDDVLVRMDPTLFHDALTRPHVREMEMGGRTMKGFVLVGPSKAVDDGELELWVKLGVTYAKSLPPKAKKTAKKKKAAKKATPAKKVTKKATGKPVKKLAKKSAKATKTAKKTVKKTVKKAARR
jgi:hypothetical protein